MRLNILSLDWDEWRVDALMLETKSRLRAKNTNDLEQRVNDHYTFYVVSCASATRFLRCSKVPIAARLQPNRRFNCERDDNVTLTIMKGERC